MLLRHAHDRCPAIASIALALGTLFLSGSCAKWPSAPRDTAAHAVPLIAPRTTLLDTDLQRVIARLLPGVSATDVAASYASSVLDYIPELRIALLRSPSGVSDRAFVTRLSSDPRIEFSQLDDAMQTAEGRQSSIAFSEGWRTWSDVCDQGAFVRVGAHEARALIPTGSPLVAILDTGIQLDHPALAAALSLPGIEPGVVESPGNDRAENVDTNGDGIVDGSWGHGTHVAGIVHALDPEARLIPVRVLDSDGVGHAFAIARGMVAAILRGAQVINMSVGMEGDCPAVRAAVDFASASGAVVVAPAGNSGAATLEFPAAYPPVLAVAGTDSLDLKAPFSNYGAGVDAAAPSVEILSTYVGGGFAVWSGTSMAAPFVAGTAALLYGALGARQPSTAQEVESWVDRGAVPLANVDPLYGSQLGAGRVSAYGSALALVAGGAPVPSPVDPTLHAFR